MTVPTGKNGKPLAKVGNGAKEMIPTAPYANIQIGPAYVEKYVEDTPEAIAVGLKECLDASELVLGAERDRILEAIKSAGIK